MQRLEVSCAVRRLYRSLGVKGLTDRNIKIVPKSAEVCEENRMMFRELKEKTSSFPSQYFFKEKKDIRKY